MNLSEMLRVAQTTPNPEGHQLLVSLAKYLDSNGLSDATVEYFLKLFQTGDPGIADVLFAHRDPLAFLAPVRFQSSLLRQVLDILVIGSAKSLDPRIILACLGFVMRFPVRASTGVNLLILSVADIQHLGKYLTADTPKIREVLLDILNSVNQAKSSVPELSRIEAGKILDHFLDRAKNLAAVLPPGLLQ